MFNLSLTACSFHLRKTNSREQTKIFDLNSSYVINYENGTERTFNDFSELFTEFFKKFNNLVKNENKQQSFRCEFDPSYQIETADYRMIYTKIYSGSYGSSSEIIDGDTEEVKYNKKPTDIDERPFYLFLVFPKDSERVKVQKGMLIFQNVGQFGVKTITTLLMQEFFSNEFKITLKCSTIAPELFIRKVIRKDNIKKFVMVKNLKSADAADNLRKGYGTELREIGNLTFSQSMWQTMMDKIRYVAGGKFNLFEFENKQYDSLKVVVEIGGRTRKIDLHNLENLSIIEGIPDEIKMSDGHPNPQKLIDYFVQVATEYLGEMVLQIT